MVCEPCNCQEHSRPYGKKACVGAGVTQESPLETPGGRKCFLQQKCCWPSVTARDGCRKRAHPGEHHFEANQPLEAWKVQRGAMLQWLKPLSPMPTSFHNNDDPSQVRDLLGKRTPVDLQNFTGSVSDRVFFEDPLPPYTHRSYLE